MPDISKRAAETSHTLPPRLERASGIDAVVLAHSGWRANATALDWRRIHFLAPDPSRTERTEPATLQARSHAPSYRATCTMSSPYSVLPAKLIH